MKKLICSIVAMTMILTTVFATTAFAGSNKVMKVKADDGRVVNFTVKTGLSPEISELKALANENSDTTSITITGMGFAPITASNYIANGAVSVTALPIQVPVPGTLVKKQTFGNVLRVDKFMASCARGETKTMTSTVTASLASEYTGVVSGLKLNGTISYQITKGTQLVGPPEGSSYNTREFRCKFYENKGTWSQMWTNGSLATLHTGTYREPYRYISYSKDTRI